MKDSRYYYGVEAGAWAKLPYNEALQMKIELGRDLISELQDAPLGNRNDSRIFDVIKAIKHNGKLLKEAI